MICPLCTREIVHLSKHHPVPKSLGGREIINICGDCHSAIHAHYTNKELKESFSTIKEMQADSDLSKAFKFLSKQDPVRRFRHKRSKQKSGNKLKG